MTTAHDIYAQQLLHLGHGLPMWGPEPSPDFGEVHLGDVGYFRDGYFCFLFNAMSNADDPINAQRGVPLGFEVFRPPESTIIRRPNHITQSQLYSRIGASASAGIRYRCSDASGALLMLKAPAHKTLLDCRLHIQKYILAHLSRWCEFANDSLGVGLEEKDIIFVSGFTKTSVWAETAFSNSSSDGELVIGGGCFAPSLSGEFQVSMTRCMDASVFARTGPYERVADWTEETGLSLGNMHHDQSIFLNFYKMKSRRWWRPQVLRAAAGPHQLPEGPDDEESFSLTGMPLVAEPESNDWEYDEVGGGRTYSP
ncbi:hypothetical protein L227DRAFT_503334 [Lentinus tigrinus ALCF2SS1-6]|uniref:Uncharacterized protein n=1 Tax=Lentinus tigrinus ALCF2SS1-6 TaxID=1328759 RepID=A0A5C2S726_9APHY|nr:hypothetical protein L227DRAFT_503334 [Lentinus tigrinus ALCF2SS1-6]